MFIKKEAYEKMIKDFTEQIDIFKEELATLEKQMSAEKSKYGELEKKYTELRNGKKETGTYCANCKYGRRKGLDLLEQYWCMKNVPCKDYEQRENY